MTDFRTISDEELLAKIQQGLSGKKQGVPWAQGGPVAGNLASSIITGGLDTAGGVAGLVSRGAEALGLPPGTDMPFIASPEIVQQRTKEAKQDVASRFGEPDMGVPRALAGGALTIPFTPVRMAMTAPTMAGRAVGSGVSGAVASTLQDVPEASDASDYWKKKATQGGAGFATGLVAGPLVETGIGAASKVANFFGERGAQAVRGAVGTPELIRITKNALAKSDIDYESLGENVKQALLRDVETALKANSSVNPGAVARQAAFRQEGFTPLQHWVTKDPGQWTVNENLAGIQGVGEPLQQTKANFEKFIVDRLNQMRGGAKVDASELGDLARRDLSGFLGNQEARTGTLYRTTREIAPKDSLGNPERFADNLYASLEARVQMKDLPEGFHGVVNDILSGKTQLTAPTILELHKAANKAFGPDRAKNAALSQFKKALEAELDDISARAAAAGGEGRFTSQAFDLARKEHAKTRAAVEGTPALRAIESGAFEPEAFFNRFIVGGSVKDVASTWAKLSDDTKEVVRQKMIDKLKEVAFGGASDASGKAAAQASFNNWLTKDGVDQKLKIILGPKGFSDVKNLGLMMESASLIPAGSKQNTSNTGAAVISPMLRMANLLKESGVPGGSAALRAFGPGQVEMALRPDAAQLGARGLIVSPEMEEFMRRYGGGLLAPSFGAGAGGLLGQ